MKRVFAAAAILALAFDCAQGAAMLSERQARAKAIGILKGDPYGKTDAAVAKNIREARLVQNADSKACGGKTTAWELHVVVVTANKDQFNNGVIDGYMAIDPRTGKMLCANLPLLD
jgi:hypothetical protein